MYLLPANKYLDSGCLIWLRKGNVIAKLAGLTFETFRPPLGTRLAQTVGSFCVTIRYVPQSNNFILADGFQFCIWMAAPLAHDTFVIVGRRKLTMSTIPNLSLFYCLHPFISL